MKKCYLVLSVVFVLLAAGACGGGSPAQPAATQPPQPTAAVSQPPAPQPTSPPSAPGDADIPLMPDAANVTTATTEEGTAITYQSASGLDTVVTFYQTEMPARGWAYQGEVSSVVGGVNAVLYFTKPGQEAAVTLTNVGTGTTVVIAVTDEGASGPPAPQPTSPPAPQPTSPPAPQPTSPSGAPAGQTDIPLMPDAANVTTATTEEGTAIIYQSASDLDTVVTFYQTEMPARGWAYQGEVSSVVGGVSAVLYFTRPSQEAAVTLTNTGAGTAVVIAVTGEGTAGPPAPQPTSPPAPQPTSPPEVQPTSPPEVQPTSPPSTGRSDIPVMADATEVKITTSGGDYTLTYKSTSGLDTAVTFYQTEMPPRGWTYLAGDSSIISGVNAVLYFTKAGEKATVTLTNMGGVIFVEVVIN